MKIVRESLNFRRNLTDTEIRRSLFDWRRGQILVVRSGESRPGEGSENSKKVTYRGLTNIYIFYEKKDSTIPSGSSIPWNIHALEIGDIAGNPSYVFIHFGPAAGIVIKREDSLVEPTPEEKNLINDALQDKKNKKYIDRATEIIGVKPFV